MHKALKILIISSIFFNFSNGLLFPIFAIFVQQIGGGILEASRAWFLYTILLGITIVTFGQMADRISKRKMFFLGRILFVVSSASYFFVENVQQLYFVQIILAISVAVIDPAFVSLFSRASIRKKESEEWAVWEGAANIAIAFGAIIGGLVAITYGFKALFVIMTASSLISLTTSAMLMRKHMWKAIAKKFTHLKS